jgi:hypothetical protein
VDGLQNLRRPEDVAKIRGKAIADVLPYKAPETDPESAEPAQEPTAPAAAEETESA